MEYIPNRTTSQDMKLPFALSPTLPGNQGPVVWQSGLVIDFSSFGLFMTSESYTPSKRALTLLTWAAMPFLSYFFPLVKFDIQNKSI